MGASGSPGAPPLLRVHMQRRPAYRWKENGTPPTGGTLPILRKKRKPSRLASIGIPRCLPYVQYGGYDAVTGERIESGPHDPPAWGVVFNEGGKSEWLLFANEENLKIARTGVAR